MSICRCGNIIEPYRLETLKSDKCGACAQRLAAMGMGAKKVKGRMQYFHKTAPVIEIMSEETFNESAKYYPRFGMGSAVVRASPRPR